MAGATGCKYTCRSGSTCGGYRPGVQMQTTRVACAPRVPSRIPKVGIAESDMTPGQPACLVRRAGVYIQCRHVPEAPNRELASVQQTGRPAPTDAVPVASVSVSPSLCLSAWQPRALPNELRCCWRGVSLAPTAPGHRRKQALRQGHTFRNTLSPSEPAASRTHARTLAQATTSNRPAQRLSPACHPPVCSAQLPAPSTHPAPSPPACRLSTAPPFSRLARHSPREAPREAPLHL